MDKIQKKIRVWISPVMNILGRQSKKKLFFVWISRIFVWIGKNPGYPNKNPDEIQSKSRRNLNKKKTVKYKLKSGKPKHKNSEIQTIQ
jgi:hypothetical protein